MNEEKPPEIMERPREVLYAVQVTFSSLVLGLILFLLKQPILAKSQIVLGIFAILMSLAFTGFILFKIFHGRNWARMLYIIFIVIGAPVAFPAVVATFQNSPVSAVIRLLQLSLQLMAVVLLLQKPTREWFKMIKLRRLMSYQLT